MPYKDKNKQREYQRIRVSQTRASWFQDKRCIQCDSQNNLELDHINPKTKISHRIWSWSSSRRLQEIVKCQVLCKKCHRQKTTIDCKRPLIHGAKNTYDYHKCRCRSCTKAHSQARDNWRMKRRKAGLSYS